MITPPTLGGVASLRSFDTLGHSDGAVTKHVCPVPEAAYVILVEHASGASTYYKLTYMTSVSGGPTCGQGGNQGTPAPSWPEKFGQPPTLEID